MAPMPTRTAWRAGIAMSVIVIVAAACTAAGSGASSGTSAAASSAPAVTAAAAAPSASSGGGKYGGGDEGDEYGTRTPAPSASAEDSGGAETYEVNVGDSDDGPYLTGKDGLALYVFGNDSANTSTCTGGCAKTWPPFTIDDGDTLKPGSGVKGKLTTFKRADGSMQVAYGGSPLYYYASDTAAGDTKGQGIGDVWYIAAP